MTHDGPMITDLCPPESWRPNVSIGDGRVMSGFTPFKCFYGTRAAALMIGARSSMMGRQFSIGPAGSVIIADYCLFTYAVLLGEESVQIGTHVVIGRNVNICD